MVGARELRRALNQLPKEYQQELKSIHKEAAETVVPTARNLAPRRSGALASSIRATGSKTRGAVAAGGARIPYAPVIHWGWPNRRIVFGKTTNNPSPIAPNPFLVEALNARKQQVVTVFEVRTSKLVERVWRRYG